MIFWKRFVSLNVIPHNPYIAGNPVGGGSGFVGRADVLREVLRMLRNPNETALVLYGQRRIGKTSMLQELDAQLPKLGPYNTVEFDLQDKAALPLAQVLHQLAATICRELALPQPPDWGESAPDLFRYQFLPNVLKQLPSDSSLVLLFDEFDVLDSPNERQAGAAFFPYLRGLIERGSRRLQFVFVIGRRPEDLSTLTLSVFKGIKSQHVSLLSKEESADLVRLSERNKTLSWSEQAVHYTHHLAGGHPFLTQLLCQIVWENAYDNEPQVLPAMQRAEIDAAVPQVIASATNSLEWLWNGLQPAERIVASALAEFGPAPISQEELERRITESGVRVFMRELQDAPRVLQEWNLIQKKDSRYRFPVELLRRWIARNKSLDRTWKEIDQLNTLADSLYQAANGYYRVGNTPTAISLLKQALVSNPNHREATLLLAESYLATEQLEEARSLLEALYETNPSAARPHLSQVLHRQIDKLPDTPSDSLFALYERLLELSPSDRRREKYTALRIRVGRAAIIAAEQSGNYERALEIGQDLHRVFAGGENLPDLVKLERKTRLESLYQQGMQAIADKQNKRAVQAFSEIIAIEPLYKETSRYFHLAVSGKDTNVLLKKQQEHEQKLEKYSKLDMQRQKTIAVAYQQLAEQKELINELKDKLDPERDEVLYKPVQDEPSSQPTDGPNSHVQDDDLHEDKRNFQLTDSFLSHTLELAPLFLLNLALYLSSLPKSAIEWSHETYLWSLVAIGIALVFQVIGGSSIMYVVAFVVTVCVADGMAVGVAGGAAIGIAVGIAVGVVGRGRLGIIFGIAGTWAFFVASGISGFITFVVAAFVTIPVSGYVREVNQKGRPSKVPQLSFVLFVVSYVFLIWFLFFNGWRLFSNS